MMEDGIYDNISIEDYHANRTHISSTRIKYAKKSLKLLNWHNRELITQEHKTQFDFGNAVELKLVDNLNFDKFVAVMPDSVWCDEANKIKEYKSVRSSSHYQEKKKEWLVANEGKYIIMDKGETESYEAIKHMIDSCNDDPIIQRLLENTEYQVSLFWTDEKTGLKVKTRPDVCKAKKNVIVNIKTARDGSPEAFSKDLANLDYPMQACIEIEGCLKTGFMESVDNYFWLVLEKEPPYNATIYEFDEQDIAINTDHMHYYFNKIAEANKNDKWPGYTDRADNKYGILRADIPAWYR